jgi:hypothetical protein
VRELENTRLALAEKNHELAEAESVRIRLLIDRIILCARYSLARFDDRKTIGCMQISSECKLESYQNQKASRSTMG